MYEMMVRGIGVMRRRADSYLNATQILKVAGVDKGKRTKILEKDIAMGIHEKVQGGYGRYQGTWCAPSNRLCARLPGRLTRFYLGFLLSAESSSPTRSASHIF